MNDPQKLIDIARQIDPEFKDPEQALIDALVVLKALAILDSQEAKPVSLIHVPKIPPQIRAAQAQLNGITEEAHKKALSKAIKKFLSKRSIRVSSFAKELDVSVSTIHGWLNGKWYPQQKYRDKIEQIMSGEIVIIEKHPYADQAQIKEGN